MAERFENWENILRDWAKKKFPKKSCRGIEHVREAERKKTERKWLRKNTRAVSVGSRARLTQHKIDLQFNFKVRNLCLEYNEPDKQNVYDLNLFKKFSVLK